MPKELFNQDLIVDPDSPSDQDRFALGQPSVQGGKNILWSRLKALFKFTETLEISDPSTETIDGITTTQQGFNRETTSSIFAIRDAIRQIAGAAATIEADPKPQTINTVETTFTFIEEIASTNPDIITVDETNNQITIKQAGLYQFATFLNVDNGAPVNNKDLILRTRNDATSAIVTERTLIIPSSGYSGTSTFTFEVLEADLPLTLNFSLQGSDTGMTLQELQSTILTGAQVNTGGGLGIIGYLSNSEIRAITGYVAGNDAINLNTGSWYKFSAIETAADDDDIYLTPNNITEPDPGRWVKQQDIFKQKATSADTVPGYLNDKISVGTEFSKSVQNPAGNESVLIIFKSWFYNAARTFKAIFNLESLTADRTITWQDKNGTIALLDDITITNQNQTTVVVSNNIDLDWNSKNYLFTENILPVSANATVTYLNTINAQMGLFAVNITSGVTLTFQAGNISPDSNWSTLAWTAPATGIFDIGIRKIGSNYIVVFTPNPAV